MGYAKPTQDSGGIHLRQFSRAVVIEDSSQRRFLYVSLDNGMVSSLLRMRLLQRLSELFGSSIYTQHNVMITATHTHSAPGGFFQYTLYNIPSAGYVSQTLESLLDGIVRSVARATKRMQASKMFYGQSELVDASINRSPSSYLANPGAERAQYGHDTDKTMHLVKVVASADGKPLGMINWFAVHGTSMNNSNHLISSDNKGWAALLFERHMNGPGWLPGKGDFVAIFAQANEGDSSPNTKGSRCVDTGLPCDLHTSTCGNPPRNEKCIAFGPGRDMFESTNIIGQRQFAKALQIFDSNSTQLEQITGPVGFIHEHIDMTNRLVEPYAAARAPNYAAHQSADLFGATINETASRRHQQHVQKQQLQDPSDEQYHTCLPALGYSFAAGTTDGPGAFDFSQGKNYGFSSKWDWVRNVLHKPSKAQVDCHKPKPILLDTGEMDFPVMWHPRIIPTQVVRVGQLVIVGLPGEFTTMSGRRVRNAVEAAWMSGANQAIDTTAPLQSRRAAQSGTEMVGQVVRRAMASVAGGYGHLASQQKQSQAFKRPLIVLSGLSNIYSSYITTFEEYQMQRYEGASTLFGPHTLQAYVNQFAKLASKLVRNETIEDLLQPPDLSANLFSLRPGVIFDSTPMGKSFGDVLQDVVATHRYECGQTVQVSFVAANPRNDLRHEQSFLLVEKFDSNQTRSNQPQQRWQTVATDASWETKFIWERTSTINGEARATIEWQTAIIDTPGAQIECEPGVYVIRHFGAYKGLFKSGIRHYQGRSSAFIVSRPGVSASELQKLLVELEMAEQSLAMEASQAELLEGQLSKKDKNESDNKKTLKSRLQSWLKIFSSQ